MFSKPARIPPESFKLLDHTDSDSDIPSPPERPKRKIYKNEPARISPESFKPMDHLDSDSDIPSSPETPKREIYEKRFRHYSPSASRLIGPKSSCLSATCSIIKAFFITILVLTVIIFSLCLKNLYNNVESLQKKAKDLEDAAKSTPYSIHDLSAQLKILKRNTSLLELEIQFLNFNMSRYVTTMTSIKKTMDRFYENIPRAPEIKKLPDNIKAVTEDIATLNNRISSLDSRLKEIKLTQDRLEEETSVLKNWTTFYMEYANKWNQTTVTLKDSKDKLASLNLTVKENEEKITKVNNSLHTIVLPKLNTLDNELRKVKKSVDKIYHFKDYVAFNLTPKVEKIMFYNAFLHSLFNYTGSSKQNQTKTAANPLTTIHKLTKLYVEYMKKVLQTENVDMIFQNPNITVIINELVAKQRKSKHEMETTTTDIFDLS